MNIINLSHLINTETPVYPGTEQPLIDQLSTVAKDGYAEKKLIICGHVGTHIDAPSHVFSDGLPLDQLPVDRFIGQAYCLKVSEMTLSHSFLEEMTPHFKDKDFLLLSTGWDKKWKSSAYFTGYPVLTEKAAQLLSRIPLKGVGFDTISADAWDSSELPIHRILLRKMILIENLTGLEPLHGKSFLFSCLPLFIDNGDGSPVRAVAITGL